MSLSNQVTRLAAVTVGLLAVTGAIAVASAVDLGPQAYRVQTGDLFGVPTHTFYFDDKIFGGDNFAIGPDGRLIVDCADGRQIPLGDHFTDTGYATAGFFGDGISGLCNR